MEFSTLQASLIMLPKMKYSSSLPILLLLLTLLVLLPGSSSAPQSFNVSTFEAKGDRVTNSSKAFKAAWKALCGGGGRGRNVRAEGELCGTTNETGWEMQVPETDGQDRRVGDAEWESIKTKVDWCHVKKRNRPRPYKRSRAFKYKEAMKILHQVHEPLSSRHWKMKKMKNAVSLVNDLLQPR